MKDIREVKIADYLHLYLGCPFVYGDGDFVREGWNGLKKSDNPTEYPLSVIWYESSGGCKHFFDATRVKPILKRLSDMTEEDYQAIGGHGFGGASTVDLWIDQFEKFEDRPIVGHGKKSVKEGLVTEQKFNKDKVEEGLKMKHWTFALLYLLSKGYWLFGDEAFDNGLIIDAKTLTKK